MWRIRDSLVGVPGEGRKKAIMYMVTPYMDHDLSGLLENPNVHFTEPQIKCYMLQLLEGLRYLHDNQILHRDMKAANLLISNRGILQIADFGLARHYDEPVPIAGRGNGEAKREYTTLVVTRWYRPPELLLQLRRYTPAIDIWGVGCVFGEMFTGKPILAGTTDLHQAQLIFNLVGSPTEQNMPGWSSLPGCESVRQFEARPSTLAQRFREQGSSAISLLGELLRLDWRKRINAIDALNHPYFQSDPLPAKPHELPQFEDSHELDRRRFRGQRAAMPPAPEGGAVGVGPQGERPGGAGAGAGAGARPGQQWRNESGGSRNGHGGHDDRPRSSGPASGIPLPAGHRQAMPRQPHQAGPTVGGRQPAWANGGGERGLPPRPPHTGWCGGDGNADRARDWDRDHDRDRDRPPIRGSGANIDTYVPSYGNSDAQRGRADGTRRDERWNGSRREDRDDRDRHPRDRRDHGRRYDEPPRRRSRSPVSERDRERGLERERERERQREQHDRDVYRR